MRAHRPWRISLRRALSLPLCWRGRLGPLAFLLMKEELSPWQSEPDIRHFSSEASVSVWKMPAIQRCLHWARPLCVKMGFRSGMLPPRALIRVWGGGRDSRCLSSCGSVFLSETGSRPSWLSPHRPLSLTETRSHPGAVLLLELFLRVRWRAGGSVSAAVLPHTSAWRRRWRPQGPRGRILRVHVGGTVGQRHEWLLQ